jgi:hypothetical protein
MDHWKPGAVVSVSCCGANRLDRLPSLRLRLSQAARDFEARTADWPVWRRLVVFVPVFLVLSWLLVVAILAILAGLRGL